MKKVIRLTESDLIRIVKRVISEESEMMTGGVSKKGSIKDIAKRKFNDLEDWRNVYNLTQNKDTKWTIVSVTEPAKIAGMSKGLEGKIVKSTDFIDLTNGGMVTLKTKGIDAHLYIQLGRDRSIESGVAWD